MKIELITNMCGKLTLATTLFGQEMALHLLPEYGHRSWGYSKDWYDGPIHAFGLGRLALLVWNREGQYG